MRLEYDPEADALYLRLKKGRVNETVEIAENVFVDLDAEGEPLGIEILSVSKRYSSEELASMGVQLVETAVNEIEGVKGMLGFDCITFDPNIMGGQACIRGMRIPVSLIVNLIAHGKSFDEILEEYPNLEPEDIKQALEYAAWLFGK